MSQRNFYLLGAVIAWCVIGGMIYAWHDKPEDSGSSYTVQQLR
jgi:hypothetical protein